MCEVKAYRSFRVARTLLSGIGTGRCRVEMCNTEHSEAGIGQDETGRDGTRRVRQGAKEQDGAGRGRVSRDGMGLQLKFSLYPRLASWHRTRLRGKGVRRGR